MPIAAVMTARAPRCSATHFIEANCAAAITNRRVWLPRRAFDLEFTRGVGRRRRVESRP